MLNKLFVVVTILVFGCSRDIPVDPMCRTNTLYTETEPSSSACIIKSSSHIIAIKGHNDDGWDLPTQKSQNTKSAQCTAHSAAWKSTGLNVEVGKFLFESPTQIQYFECKLTDEFSKQLKQFPPPPWAKRKIKEISLIDPFNTQHQQWVNTINLVHLREAYNQLD